MIAIAQGWTGFVVLWAAAYAGLVALYLFMGLALVALNRRHPERRIQPEREPSGAAGQIRQSLIALVSIAGYLAGGLSLQANGYALFAPGDLTATSLALWAVISFVVYDTWFYWGHRMMHTRAFYRFHALHHRAITPSTWTNNSDSFVGAAVEQGYFLIAPLLLPIPPVVLIIHKIYDQASGMVSHCGHEYVASRTARAPWPLLCTIFHDQHHSNFRCNFGNTFSLWDRAMGTLHPTYDVSVERMEHLDKVRASDAPGT
ncbi:sterol desaturase/sphingolipid hydroxylase (fatty acid hydroxylase superfamily) [Breoghania corrubedonensis]|uniref:Sterol desaturase/sphingolipid hydroxylase (Fatty acid hydroxylase superfamily) n=1 Tax=Breoghania corrubedonensis TaxID=665038 RepID=A0A2T5VCQ4_9HYPH|nr:sterol desaturase family protein [Breoghania corrubedonensis]PTW61543.1 sterol desaturase/sphingolipid hydroxylase (fatty acid hydroxylase superfamily) [Breoghania corrubedonensis]